MTSEFDKEIENSIIFLVNAAPKESGKSVIFHSLKVGLYLYEKGHSKEVVIAGILHDLLEDSDTTYEKIEKEFGNKVAELVQANSFDKTLPGKTIKDKKKKSLQTFDQCLTAGKSALIIKAADILDNSNYCHLAEGKKMREYLLEKIKYFINLSAKKIKNETVWKDLNKQYQLISKKHV